MLDLVRLIPEHNLESFQSGDQDLDAFLCDDAMDYQTALLGVTYLLMQEARILAYTTLLNDRIGTEESISGDPPIKTRVNNKRRKMPGSKRLRTYPAVKIGRLAVDENAQNDGIGRKLMSTLIGWFVVNNKTGCRYMTVDAISTATRFYEKMDFEFLVPSDADADTRIMFLDLLPYQAVEGEE